MAKQEHGKKPVDPRQFTVLAPVPPFVDIILQYNAIKPQEFARIAKLASSYPNDPRLIEMVRRGGDASAKVPYLMDEGETPDTILAALREVAQPHVEHLKTLPGAVQATIHTLLSINLVPRGCEAFGIPALLEIDRMQREMVRTLKSRMADRREAQEFHRNNFAALQILDQAWGEIREDMHPAFSMHALPEHSQLQYLPIYTNEVLASVHELCVVVDVPDRAELRRLTPPVLKYPLPEDVEAPLTGSADWLLRVVGKIGRHFTRALLDIVNAHLAEEEIALHAHNYDQINRQAHTALREFMEGNP